MSKVLIHPKYLELDGEKVERSRVVRFIKAKKHWLHEVVKPGQGYAWVMHDDVENSKKYPPYAEQSMRSLLDYAVWLCVAQLYLRGEYYSRAETMVTDEVAFKLM